MDPDSILSSLLDHLESRYPFASITSSPSLHAAAVRISHDPATYTGPFATLPAVESPADCDYCASTFFVVDSSQHAKETILTTLDSWIAQHFVHPIEDICNVEHGLSLALVPIIEKSSNSRMVIGVTYSHTLQPLLLDQPEDLGLLIEYHCAQQGRSCVLDKKCSAYLQRHILTHANFEESDADLSSEIMEERLNFSSAGQLETHGSHNHSSSNLNSSSSSSNSTANMVSSRKNEVWIIRTRLFNNVSLEDLQFSAVFLGLLGMCKVIAQYPVDGIQYFPRFGYAMHEITHPEHAGLLVSIGLCYSASNTAEPEGYPAFPSSSSASISSIACWFLGLDENSIFKSLVNAQAAKYLATNQHVFSVEKLGRRSVAELVAKKIHATLSASRKKDATSADGPSQVWLGLALSDTRACLIANLQAAQARSENDAALAANTEWTANIDWDCFHMDPRAGALLPTNILLEFRVSRGAVRRCGEFFIASSLCLSNLSLLTKHGFVLAVVHKRELCLFPTKLSYAVAADGTTDDWIVAWHAIRRLMRASLVASGDEGPRPVRVVFQNVDALVFSLLACDVSEGLLGMDAKADAIRKRVSVHVQQLEKARPGVLYEMGDPEAIVKVVEAQLPAMPM